MTKKEIEARMHGLFQRYVPASGKANTVAGEILRAYSQITYRYQNDGDAIGEGYGKETCNPAARYLADTCGGSISDIIYTELWNAGTDEEYEEYLLELGEDILEYLDLNQREVLRHNSDDMWNRATDEDRDNYEDEEDY
jgi:hypothetical protein